MRFHTTILTAGKTAAGIRIPNDVLAALGSGRKPAVRVTINGYTYRSTVAWVNGAPMVGVSAENRAAAGVAGGEDCDVDLELDTEPREVMLPPDFDAGLEREPAARRFFDSLSYSDKRFHTLPIEGAKTAETRRRRIEKSIAALREGRKR
jgi:hypothetical protein